MLEKITDILRDYSDYVKESSTAKKEALDKINANYKSVVARDKADEIRKIYTEELKKVRTESRDKCHEVLNEAAEKAHQVALEPVPEEFASTFAFIKALESPSQGELEALASKYQNNYFTYRALYNILNTGMKPVTIDVIEDAIENIRTHIDECIEHNSINDYHFRNWRDGEILPEYDKTISAFIDGRFSDIDTRSLEELKSLGSSR